jgi:hypothetical protein
MSHNVLYLDKVKAAQLCTILRILSKLSPQVSSPVILTTELTCRQQYGHKMLENHQTLIGHRTLENYRLLAVEAAIG